MLIFCLHVPGLYWEFDFPNHGNQTSFSGLGSRGQAANKDVPNRCAEFAVVGWLINQDRVADATETTDCGHTGVQLSAASVSDAHLTLLTWKLKGFAGMVTTLWTQHCWPRPLIVSTQGFRALLPAFLMHT